MASKKSKIIKPRIRLPHKPTKVHQDRTKRIPRKSKYKEFVSASVEDESFNSRFAPGDLVVHEKMSWKNKYARIHRIVEIDFQARSYSALDGDELIYLTEVHFLNLDEKIDLRVKTVREIDREYRKLTPTEELLYGPRIKSVQR